MISAEPPPLRKRWATKAEGAYQSIRFLILDGSLKPGSTIDQRALAMSLGISTTPLREAFRRLESEGFVRQAAHHEMRVSELSLDELQNLYDVRIQLVPYASALAVENATDDDRQNVSKLAQFPSDVPAATLLAHHQQFHRAIYSSCHNQILVEILDSLADRSNRYRLYLLEDFLATGVPLVVHKEIAGAFVDGRAAELASLLESDLRTTRRQLVERLGQEPLGED
ncbi:GntR family transcriptional regulator [Saccharopolyspora shandongensis]|uniref:GntR family transcriptional regulator n=1 Tax=Saccharopolyspora shandongensis TaxID=418495 RepID=UPI0033DD931E